ncbi:MAG TPA: hypothetical protein VMZ25_03980 [Terriglobales bacterium]|nr:hypothetical protein [Terriglobales bacterium]
MTIQKAVVTASLLLLASVTATSQSRPQRLSRTSGSTSLTVDSSPTTAAGTTTSVSSAFTFQKQTTLTEQRANNTSATSTFKTFLSDPGNRSISKEKSRNLLYSGSQTKLYAALMMWWGKSGHIDAGYSSLDSSQITRQVTDMQERGIDGAIVTWFGQNSYEDQATRILMLEAEKRIGFEFSVMLDEGSIRWASCAGCNATDALIAHLNYIASAYYSSPAYMRRGGRPVVYEFGLEHFTIDWVRVRASVAGNPLVIFRNGGGYDQPTSDGAYSWVAPEDVSGDDPSALKYLDWFFSQAKSTANLAKTTVASAYPGFNDQLATWSTNRKITEDCGQTWLKTMSETGKYYSALTPLDSMQLVTWNDYEEGTALESGIDNCVSVTASLNNTVVSWEITGQQNTIDHFTIFLGDDSENLMALAELPVTARSIDLSTFGITAGNYQVYVRAVGKPSLRNQFSAGVPLRYLTTVRNKRPGRH